MLALLEREVAATRIGATGPDGAVAQVEVAGVIAAALRPLRLPHRRPATAHPRRAQQQGADARATASGAAWTAAPCTPPSSRSPSTTTPSLADHLTRTLGVAWEQRQRGRDRNPAWEIAGVPEELLAAFSSRSTAIDAATDELIAAYRDRHGHQPVARRRSSSCAPRRPWRPASPSSTHSLADLTARWRTTATAVLGVDAQTWAARAARRRRVRNGCSAPTTCRPT